MKGFGMAKSAFLALAVLAALLLLGRANAQLPALPTIVSGTVTADGVPAPAGKLVVALIDGSECGSTATAAGSSYTLQVGGRPGNPPICDQSGATISFAVDGKPAQETTTRQPGALVTLNLTVTTATPIPTPAPAVAFVPGLNVVQYRSAYALPVEQALGNCLGAVDAVFIWDATAQAWNWWIKVAPQSGVNTLTTLNPGAILWVIASAACNWMPPAA